MKLHQRNAVLTIAGLVEARGCTVALRQGGKHLAVVVTHRSGAWHKFPVSGTPRDADCQLNQIRQQVTAWLEQCGAAPARGQAGERRTGGPRRRKMRPTAPPFLTTRPDPWEALSALRFDVGGDGL